MLGNRPEDALVLLGKLVKLLTLLTDKNLKILHVNKTVIFRPNPFVNLHPLDDLWLDGCIKLHLQLFYLSFINLSYLINNKGVYI